ncbi:hypothetical protein DXO397_10975 [Xanthomonas oryzae pv. oryzae]|nr:hypothetical protein DXO397_10975 [Xanthomonas oryzae pv. oryzae]
MRHCAPTSCGCTTHSPHGAHAPCCCCWVCDCCCSNATDWRAAFSATRWLLCSSGVFIAVMVSMLTRSCAGSSTRPCTAKVRAASGLIITASMR